MKIKWAAGPIRRVGPPGSAQFDLVSALIEPDVCIIWNTKLLSRGAIRIVGLYSTEIAECH